MHLLSGVDFLRLGGYGLACSVVHANGVGACLVEVNEHAVAYYHHVGLVATHAVDAVVNALNLDYLEGAAGLSEGVGQGQGDAIVAALAVGQRGAARFAVALAVGYYALVGFPSGLRHNGEGCTCDEGAARRIFGNEPAESALAFAATSCPRVGSCLHASL